MKSVRAKKGKMFFVDILCFVLNVGWCESAKGAETHFDQGFIRCKCIFHFTFENFAVDKGGKWESTLRKLGFCLWLRRCIGP